MCAHASQVRILSYTEEEYARHLVHPAWNKAESDQLFDLRARMLTMRIAPGIRTSPRRHPPPQSQRPTCPLALACVGLLSGTLLRKPSPLRCGREQRERLL